MARYFLSFPSSTTFLMVLSFFVLIKCCRCLKHKHVNKTTFHQKFDSDWHPASATWYGPPDGAGSDGGACGYLDTVERPPFSKMISAGGPSIYQSGQGCGVCYQVKCSGNGACSGRPVTVTITDECPGCPAVHFDLSGTAFGALAKPGLNNQLRNAGRIQVQYRMIRCDYGATKVAVRVDPGSNPYYFAAAIEYEDGTGLSRVELQPRGGGWMSMRQSWGAVWAVNPGSQLQAPFSIRLTGQDSRDVLVLSNVIPVGWQPGQTYRSRANFNN
ncbi:hypothetical protein vseg_004380 [Gypsophila vaccaria]